MRAAFLVVPLLLAGCLAGKPDVVAPTDTAKLLPHLPDFGSVVTVGTKGNEPVVRVAPDGTIYVAALAYVYVSTDHGVSFHAVDFKGAIPVYASDSALAVSPTGRAYVTFDWPYAGHTAVCASGDRGASWSCDAAAVPGATDRMWVLAPTENDVYLITGQTLDRPTFAVSHDQGKTFTTTYQDLQTSAQGADLAWDPINKKIIQAADDQSPWGVRTFSPDGKFDGFRTMDLGVTSTYNVAIDSVGTWWATACVPKAPQCPPAAASSKDQGKTWTVTPVPFTGKVSMMHFIAAGDAGRAAMVWYQTAASSSDAADAEWLVGVSQTADGEHWTTKILTDTPVHKGPLCRAITCFGSNRFAGDFLGLAFDEKGDAYATWNRQTGEKLGPVGPNPSDWEAVEFARTMSS